MVPKFVPKLVPKVQPWTPQAAVYVALGISRHPRTLPQSPPGHPNAPRTPPDECWQLRPCVRGCPGERPGASGAVRGSVWACPGMSKGALGSV